MPKIQAGGAADTAVGFEFFAATMMIMVGVFQAIQGLVALFNDTFYLVGEKWTFQFDVFDLGVVHLLFGALLIVAGHLPVCEARPGPGGPPWCWPV